MIGECIFKFLVSRGERFDHVNTPRRLDRDRDRQHSCCSIKVIDGLTPFTRSVLSFFASWPPEYDRSMSTLIERDKKLLSYTTEGRGPTY